MQRKFHTEVVEGNTKPSTLTRHRAYCFTSFDVSQNYWNEAKMKYLLIGTEVCPSTKRQHLQGYVVMNQAQTFKYMKKHIFPNGEHFEVCHGSFGENYAYCTKEKNFKEWGVKPAQGARTDLIDIRNDLSEGKVRVDDIIMDHPELYHQYGRTLHAIEDVVMSKKFRTEVTKGYWLYGSTGIGKSHIAFTGFTPETHYMLSKDNGWWDMYRGQETVIINDFRGFIEYDELLQIVDKWPYNVKRRGRPPLPFVSKRVIITSALSPEEVYHNRNEKDDIAQLLRRFQVFNMDNDIERLQSIVAVGSRTKRTEDMTA